jgi:excinuclease UvrABC nuclease subunit
MWESETSENRIRTYFGASDGRPMIPFMVPKIINFEWVVTGTEKEASFWKIP